MPAIAEDEVVHLGFAEQVEAARNGWLQGRYYSEDGDTVADVLSFRSVYEINPFVVGVSHARERRVYAAWRKVVEQLLDVRELMGRAFTSLSNGEMRRVLFARALLKGPKKLVLDDPYGGLDPAHRARMREVLGELRARGVEVVVCNGQDARCPSGRARRPRRAAVNGQDARCPSDSAREMSVCKGDVLVDLRNVNVKFGRRVLFKNFAWTIREGERWLLRGPNGSGKTTLLSLITGDSPLGYACDVTVFGQRRGAAGSVLADVRRKIGSVSPEQQVYLGESPATLLSAALRKKPRLLLLDEPCYSQGPAAAKKILARIASWLDRHPRAAAVCVSHRADQIPAGFNRVLDLGPSAPLSPAGAASCDPPA
ncbi:MAG: ATP-binding cassette domain-containing protein [Kiritimatiellae bacterium]|nr:ATP-binding cassette domain-containing protein [Kiritimatiellia bacterium]